MALPFQFSQAVLWAVPESETLVNQQWVRLEASQPTSAPWRSGNGRYVVCTVSAVRSEGSVQAERQDLLWQHFFQDPTKWWDNRPDKRSSSHPDFRHKTSKEALWLDNRDKPGWVDLQLARWDAGEKPAQDGCKVHAEVDAMVQTLYVRCEEGELRDAVEALTLLVQRGCCVSQSLYYRVLKRCMARKDLGLGRRVHALAEKSGYQSSPFLANHIIRMYGFHGQLEDAFHVFIKVTAPDAYMWASLILAHVRHGEPRKAVELYRQMRDSSVEADNHVFAAVLRACASAEDLVAGKEVHADIVASAVQADVVVSNSLVNMYAKCGRMDDARSVFDRLGTRDVVTWNTIITGYTQQGLGGEALALYASMQEEALALANPATFMGLLQACSSVGALHLGQEVHERIRAKGMGTDLLVGNSLVDMYAKCGSLETARGVFDGLPTRDVVTWNTIIAGYTQQGLSHDALAMYERMQEEGVTASEVTFVCLLQACASIGIEAVLEGKALHEQIRGRDLETGTLIGSCLVEMYAKCGSVEKARSVFDRMSTRNVVTWTSMIAGYAQHGLGQEALALYSTMQQEGMTPPDRVTFLYLLKACASLESLHLGKGLHTQIKQQGLEGDLLVGNCLIEMYLKCGSLEDARRVFNGVRTRDIVTWNTMIAGYAQRGLGQEALDLYDTMQADGLTPANQTTFVSLLHACATVGRLYQGKQLHAQIRESGLEADVSVGSSLVNMYAKCGSLKDARSIFDNLLKKDVVTWTAMIAGYSQQAMGQEALDLYAAMQLEGMTPANHVTFVCLLQACATLGALHQGKGLHVQIEEMGLLADVQIGNSLVNMYAKCGSMGDARMVFDRLPARDAVTWSALLNGYAEHGDGQMAMACFEEMLQQGVQPDATSFICLLVACSHAGLVSEGRQYFRTMVDTYGIVPTDQHHSCMVDLIARSGHLSEAEDMILSTRFENDFVAWKSLLSACKNHGDVDRGRRSFNRLVELEPEHASSYVLLANIYANAGRWTDVDRIESMRKGAGARKKPAKAGIEVNNKVHEFTVGEGRVDISSKVRTVNARLKEEGGHVPQTDLVLKAVSEQEKEDTLCGHAEKLALAYGLLNTPDGTTLLVTKNLRMCNDCHTSTKIMSNLENREIIVRDAHRVHRFVNGSCNCGDRH